MGKIKQRRQRNARFNPIGLSQENNTENVAEVELEEKDSGDVSPSGLKVIGEKVQ